MTHHFNDPVLFKLTYQSKSEQLVKPYFFMYTYICYLIQYECNFSLTYILWYQHTKKYFFPLLSPVWIWWYLSLWFNNSEKQHMNNSYTKIYHTAIQQTSWTTTLTYIKHDNCSFVLYTWWYLSMMYLKLHHVTLTHT